MIAFEPESSAKLISKRFYPAAGILFMDAWHGILNDSFGLFKIVTKAMTLFLVDYFCGLKWDLFGNYQQLGIQISNWDGLRDGMGGKWKGIYERNWHENYGINCGSWKKLDKTMEKLGKNLERNS